MKKQRPVGINHIALKVDDIDEALEFYGKFLDFEVIERQPGHVEIGLGDQFIAFEDDNAPDPEAHFGLVVEDKEAFRQALEEKSVEVVGSRLDFKDPWGNRVQIVQYDQVQFSKTYKVLKGMGLKLGKTKEAQAELKEKGLA
jgi:catechol 2,3-dioxygenase-like lactoylglutathione lyase family enzyme